MLQKRSLLRALAADEHNQTSFLQNDFQGGKGPGPRVVLNGHVDVFPVVDGRLHGRGVVDMKSGTASLIIAYAFLYERRHLLSGSVALCAVADEETGGKWGTKYLIEQDKHRWGGDLMLCAEPGGLETIRFAEKGSLRLTCTIKTKGTLGPCLHLSEGAIRTASAFIYEIIKSVESLPVDLPDEMERRLEKPEVKRAIDQAMGPGTITIIARPTVNVGTIKGGLKVNMIPETCMFELDIRMPVGIREDTVLELIDTIIPQYEPASSTIKKQAAASNPFNYSVIDHYIVSHLKDNAKSLRPGADAPVPIPSMGGSDCKHYRVYLLASQGVLPSIALNFTIMPEKKILALGSGMVAKPCVDYLLRDKKNVLTIACRTLSSTQNVAAERSSAKAAALDVASPELGHHVAEHDLVISLVPFVHHAAIVQSAIKGNTNVITTSYDSPTPEVSDNPLRFKQISATFLQDGNLIEVSNKDLMNKAVLYHVLDGYSFLAYPNRDSVPYRSKAWLNEGLKWSHIQQQLTGAASATEVDLLAKIDEVCSFRSPEERSKILVGLKWMGLFSDEVAAVRDSPLGTLRSTGQDMQLPGRTSALELFGEPGGYSAMAKSVGLTCGIAIQLLLDDEPASNKPGVIAPYSREICDPIRVRAEAEGIKLVEHTL
ncbi:Saccharopine dehydrogenase [NADP+, L-glutamate-forming] [Fusarium odoratissimum]|uniref:Saccharopine dehydrogenase [NADP+, L-glutamate-forming] n=1 Tax=Fusarium oxysporum f. sp. cubense (strain race 4) TaxID=2502994 RepID=N1RYB4_FUSC4|nr:Saccharopine dehydrogenase [NADP+, L-glutamate-forming] [Fusarium odoratissimum]